MCSVGLVHKCISRVAVRVSHKNSVLHFCVFVASGIFVGSWMVAGCLGRPASSM